MNILASLGVTSIAKGAADVLLGNNDGALVLAQEKREDRLRSLLLVERERASNAEAKFGAMKGVICLLACTLVAVLTLNYHWFGRLAQPSNKSNWSADIHAEPDISDLVECPVAEDFFNTDTGKITSRGRKGGRYFYRDHFQYQCYSPQFTVAPGHGSIRCQSDGTWSATPLCVEKKAVCSSPPVISNADMNLIKLNSVQEAHYTCDFGYWKERTTSPLRCEWINGETTWVGEVPSCKRYVSLMELILVCCLLLVSTYNFWRSHLPQIGNNLPPNNLPPNNLPPNNLPPNNLPPNNLPPNNLPPNNLPPNNLPPNNLQPQEWKFSRDMVRSTYIPCQSQPNTCNYPMQHAGHRDRHLNQHDLLTKQTTECVEPTQISMHVDKEKENLVRPQSENNFYKSY